MAISFIRNSWSRPNGSPSIWTIRVVVLDCTTHLIPTRRSPMTVEPGREDFENGHITGAQFCDVSRDVSDTTQKLRFMRQTPEEFAAAMRRFGVSNDTQS